MTPFNFLKRHHRRCAWRFPLWLAVAGLVLVFAVIHAIQRQPFFTVPSPTTWIIWSGGIIATLLAAIAAFFARRRSLADTARASDISLVSHNRLEAFAQLSGTNHPLASAQQGETSAWLAGQMLPAGRSVEIAIGAGLLAVLILLHLFLAGVWTVHSRAIPKPEIKPVPLSKLPHAELHWKSPKPEIKATKIEDIPLVAEAESTSGLQNITLEIAVNGVPKKSLPLPVAPFDQKGTHPLKTSIYLDELEVEPFDLVSYHLRGERIFTEKLPATTSEMQFIQIRPFREDAVELKGDGTPSKCLAILTKLKIAQLRAMKQNFILAGAELPKTDELWKAENKRVADDQALLTSKVDEAIPVMIEGGMPAEIVNLLMQARPHMASAAELIAAADNAAATPEQGKSLALIIECEKLFMKAFVWGKSKPADAEKPKDPFADKQQFKLKPREQTAAGNLEKLAKDQAKLNSEINAAESGKSPTDAAERQKQISRALGEAANSGQFDEKTTQELSEARSAAQEAAGQLDAADPEAAKEPAARTLQHLQAALDQINKSGKQSAAETLAEAQKKLNDAANQMHGSGSDSPKKAEKAGEKAAEAGAGMMAEAERQQEYGSAAAAAALGEIVKKLQDSRAGQELAQRAQGSQGPAVDKLGEKLEALAKAAAAQQTKLLPGKEALTDAIDALRRAQANAGRLAGKASGDAQAIEEVLSEIQAATQKAEVLSPGNNGIGKRIIGELRTIRNNRSTQVTVDLSPLPPLLEEWIQLLTKEVATSERDEIVNLSRPEEAPSGYRESVAEYFELLSKDYEKPKPEEAK
ncbi:MAG TPA: hypothetical protein VIT91_16665 [Chthoniobacterales bacterium]